MRLAPYLHPMLDTMQTPTTRFSVRCGMPRGKAWCLKALTMRCRLSRVQSRRRYGRSTTESGKGAKSTILRVVRDGIQWLGRHPFREPVMDQIDILRGER